MRQMMLQMMRDSLWLLLAPVASPPMPTLLFFCTYSCNVKCVFTGGKATMMVLTASGSRKAKAVPLIMGDSVEKADIEICKHPSGRGDWLLGTGASGKVLFF